MLNADLTPRHSACLQRLAEWTEAVIALSVPRIEAAEGRDFLAEVALFNDLGRSLRLTLGLELRLASLMPLSAKAAVQDARRADLRPERLEALERPEILEAPETLDRAETLARADNDHRPRRLEFERESETESDGHPDTPLGRAEALEELLAKGSHLDPDGRITAEIIQIKAFLTEGSPEPPRGEPPGRGPPSPPPSTSGAPGASDPPLGRPLNRAERRRLRRSSG